MAQGSLTEHEFDGRVLYPLAKDLQSLIYMREKITGIYIWTTVNSSRFLCPRIGKRWASEDRNTMQASWAQFWRPRANRLPCTRTRRTLQRRSSLYFSLLQSRFLLETGKWLWNKKIQTYYFMRKNQLEVFGLFITAFHMFLSPFQGVWMTGPIRAMYRRHTETPVHVMRVAQGSERTGAAQGRIQPGPPRQNQAAHGTTAEAAQDKFLCKQPLQSAGTASQKEAVPMSASAFHTSVTPLIRGLGGPTQDAARSHCEALSLPSQVNSFKTQL